MAHQKDEIWRKELMSLMDAMIGGGVKVKSAAEVGKRCVEYTRGDEIISWILNNKSHVLGLCPTNLNGNTISDENDAIILADALIQNGFISRAQYQPLEGILEKSSTGAIKRPMWPKRLIKTAKQRFDSTGFYIISYETNQRWNYFMLTAMMLGIFSLCMFQAWPLIFKLAMWYISFVILSTMLLIVLLRLFLFILFWLCGYDYWLFPNLFDEDLGLVDSFKPLSSLTYRGDDSTMMLCRAVCVVLISASVYELRKTHDLRDVGKFAKQSFFDVLEWGHHKLAAAPEEQSIYNSLGADFSKEFDKENGDDVNEADDDDYKCLLECGFKSLNQLMKECMTKCDCMNELLENLCVDACPQETIKVLRDARSDICRRVARKKIVL